MKLFFKTNSELIILFLKKTSYQAMSSTCTQSQLFTVIPISSFCSVLDFISAIAFVSCHVGLIENL